MNLKKVDVSNAADRQVVITRVINAPRERVWEAMTDPKQVVQWWGPAGFTNTLEKHEFRVGGQWKHMMHGPDGADYPNLSTFTEIVKHERIGFMHGGARKGGDTGAAFQALWTFEVQGDKTKLTMSMTFPTAEARDKVVKEYNAIEGGNHTLNRLQLYVKGQTIPFVIERTFNASRELVWKCWTEQKRMSQWWGPKGAKVLKSMMDFRVGGNHHYGMEYMGHTMWGKQIYREIVPPEKLVFINQFSDEKGGLGRHPMSPDWPAQMLTTITFTEREHKTTVVIEWVPIEATDVERKTFDEGRQSMRQGWGGTLDQLAEYLAKALVSI